MADKEKIGWVSPVYTKSRAIKLDSNVLAKNRLVAMNYDSPEVDYYKVLRTRILRRTQDQGGRSIMITSTLPEEGKTLTAINLALTFAREYEHTVLLVDCDLRKQQIHKLLGYPSEKGLANYLFDNCPLSELIVWPGIEKFTVISGGRTLSESSENLASPQMKDLMTDMKNRYPERYIFFDAPPILVGADAIAFAPLVDWIIVVVQAGKTSMLDVNRALQLIPKDKFLGLVLNRQTSQFRKYPYPYR
ncbi:MAG: polysaccharide biosynthesis tyrosine autokinase [Syntrophales bacterium]